MIEIREPKFKVGQKIKRDKHDNILTIKSVNRFSFEEGDYFYKANNNRGDYYGIIRESDYEIYIEKPKTVWDLKKGDKCYFLASDGDVLDWVWDDNPLKIRRRKLGDLFLTKEEAEFEIERRKIETEMLRLGGKRKAEQGKVNWFLEYRPVSGRIETLWSSYEMDQGVIYFESEEKAKKAVETIGKDRIKKYIFGVEE